MRKGKFIVSVKRRAIILQDKYDIKGFGEDHEL